MLSFVFANLAYGLFECYLFLAFWFFRITFLDRLVERLMLLYFKKQNIEVVLNYEKQNKETFVNGTKVELKNGHGKRIRFEFNDRRMFAKIAAYPTLGCTESFIDGWIDADSDSLVGFWKIVLENEHDYVIYRWHLPFRFWNWLLYDCINNQTKRGVKRLMKVHYDFGNDVFERLIGPTMQYSCGYWRNATNLEEAQTHKMDLIARKLKLQPGMRVLDIGCGWGSLANHLSSNYDVHVTGVTPSIEGVKYIKEKFKDNNKIEAVCADYREMRSLGHFDRIVSVGMFEHVGHKNYRQFFDICRERLKEDGILLLHTIAANQNKPFMFRTDRSVDKHVFPCGELPYQAEFVKAFEHRFVIEDWHNFGPDYWKTIDAWFRNWEQNKDYILSKYGIKTYRCFFGWTRTMIFFHYRRLHLWQVVLTKNGIVGGYESLR